MRYLLAILFALFSITGNGQPIFETQFERGSYISRQGDVFTITGGAAIRKGEKGLVHHWESGVNLVFENPITLSKESATLVVEFKGWDESTAVRYMLYGGSGIKSRIIKNTNDLEMESNTNGSYWFDYTTTSAQRKSFQNEFQQLIVTADGGNVVAYINGIQIDTGIPSDDITFTHIGTITSAFEWIKKIIVYDSPLSTTERNRLYADFVNSYPVSKEVYLRHNPHSKSTDLSNEPGLVAAYNMIPSAGGVLTDISGNGNNGAISGPISTVDGLVFDGIDDEINFSNINLGKTYTLCFRIKPKVYTRFLLNGSGNDDYVLFNTNTSIIHRVNNNSTTAQFTVSVMPLNETHNIILTRNGTTTIKCYLNGVQEGGNQVVGSNDDFEIDGISNHSSSFYNGEYIDFKVYNYTFSEQQAKDYSNQYAKRIKLISDFSLDPVGTAIPQNFIPGTGTYEIKELASQDAVLKHLDVGTKYLECTSAGTIAIPSKSAYGTWEFDMYKGTTATGIDFGFIVPKIINRSASGTSYWFSLGGDERIYLRANGTSTLFFTALSYITWATWYRIKITRTKDGEFYVYIKGGTFGDQYILVSVAGGAGTNPVTNNNNTTSEYLVLDFDVGDKISGIKILSGVVQ